MPARDCTFRAHRPENRLCQSSTSCAARTSRISRDFADFSWDSSGRLRSRGATWARSSRAKTSCGDSGCFSGSCSPPQYLLARPGLAPVSCWERSGSGTTATGGRGARRENPRHREFLQYLSTSPPAERHHHPRLTHLTGRGSRHSCGSSEAVDDPGLDRFVFGIGDQAAVEHFLRAQEPRSRAFGRRIRRLRSRPDGSGAKLNTA